MSFDFSSVNRRTFLQGLSFGAAFCVLGDRETSGSPGVTGAGGSKLPRTTPESVGIAPAGIAAFLDAVEKKVGGLHSFMLLRQGKVAAEGWWTPYAPQYPHMLFSLSKSFTSTAVGLAVSEGLLTVDTPVTSFFPNELPAKVSENLAAMRVRHLLTMNTGHDQDATGGTVSNPDGNWVKGFLSLPVEHAPGSKFVYNSAATYMLSAIVQKRTGKPVLEYLKPHLFDPIGIEGQTWENCPKGINTGGWGLSVKTEDIAKFGQLYLQKGMWNGKRLISEAWIADATSKQVSNGDPNSPSDWSQGYGYQFWQCRHGLYRGDGAFGQYCIVMPSQDAVLAITSGVGDMQAVLVAVWDHLLPAIQQAPLSKSEGAGELKQKLSSLAVPVPKGDAESPVAGRVSGKTYRFDNNDQKIQSVKLNFDGKRCAISLVNAQGEQKFTCGADTGIKGTAALAPDRPAAHLSARGAWTDENTYTATLILYETPFINTTTFKFEGDKVTMQSKMNVNFGPTEMPALVGHAV